LQLVLRTYPNMQNELHSF